MQRLDLASMVIGPATAWHINTSRVVAAQKKKVCKVVSNVAWESLVVNFVPDKAQR
jgi:hypothetical protein